MIEKYPLSLEESLYFQMEGSSQVSTPLFTECPSLCSVRNLKLKNSPLNGLKGGKDRSVGFVHLRSYFQIMRSTK